ncbi:hypothetical protein CPB83DRAFT_870188 [Crepidotus variabilis]|uniref:JmjC domain-containing protein n=1 Tax=Crepidotus variabilis TaxID=179855 RepID=A0A9P6ECL9_9AGAR|nr:hypothetical protein CPB83DRAFT_870188 [Crepidotus variabilis]
MSAAKLAVSTRGWSFQGLIESSSNFYAVDRVSASSHNLQEALKNHEEDGIPLVVEGFHKLKAWPYGLFSLENFCKQVQSKDISVRNVHNWKDKEIPLEDFITKSRTMSHFAEDDEVERLYGKDAECPSAWEEELRDEALLPSNLFCGGSHDEFRFRPASSPIETLMCYLGVGDTYTPCHKDLCASSGHNLMCYTEEEGSSFWFMTASSDAPAVSAYFHTLHQELDHENHVITLEQLVKSPFKVYVVEQKLGDLVLVPPRSAHQVVNYGGITLKTSWSRMTTRGLAVAYYHELPIYRRVCRPETYRVKSTVYYALKARTEAMTALERYARSNDKAFVSVPDW